MGQYTSVGNVDFVCLQLGTFRGIKLTLRVDSDEYVDLGFKLTANTKPGYVAVLADTGC